MDKEIDKPDTKNRNPGDLKNPPKRRRVSKAKINRLTDYWTPVEVRQVDQLMEVQEILDPAQLISGGGPELREVPEDKNKEVPYQAQEETQDDDEVQVPRGPQDNADKVQGGLQEGQDEGGSGPDEVPAHGVVAVQNDDGKVQGETEVQVQVEDVQDEDGEAQGETKAQVQEQSQHQGREDEGRGSIGEVGGQDQVTQQVLPAPVVGGHDVTQVKVSHDLHGTQVPRGLQAAAVEGQVLLQGGQDEVKSPGGSVSRDGNTIVHDDNTLSFASRYDDNTRSFASRYEHSLNNTQSNMTSVMPPNGASKIMMSDDIDTDEGEVPPDHRGDDHDHKGEQDNHHHPQLMMPDRSVNNAKVIDRSDKSIVQILRPSSNREGETGKRISKPSKRKSKLELAKLHNKSQLGVFDFLRKREGKSDSEKENCVEQRRGGEVELIRLINLNQPL